MSTGTLTFRGLLCLHLFIVTVLASQCNQSQCRGPVQYYKDLGCKPIYEKPGDCCAIRYDCSHLNRRTKNKCYINNKEYKLGETLREENTHDPCDLCTCETSELSEWPEFVCMSISCFNDIKIRKGCTKRRIPGTCCETKEVCPSDNEIICKVDGETYYNGETFYPKSNPEVVCTCKEGYKGKNIKPFCKNLTCKNEPDSAENVRQNCAPIYSRDRPPSVSCSSMYACQQKDDKVIHPVTKGSLEKKNKSISGKISGDMKCRFGTLTMEIDDLIKQKSYPSFCALCVCEVPPIPTCRGFPVYKCN